MVVGERERLIDRAKGAIGFLYQFIVDFVDVENIEQLLVDLVLSVF